MRVLCEHGDLLTWRRRRESFKVATCGASSSMRQAPLQRQKCKTEVKRALKRSTNSFLTPHNVWSRESDVQGLTRPARSVVSLSRALTDQARRGPTIRMAADFTLCHAILVILCPPTNASQSIGGAKVATGFVGRLISHCLAAVTRGTLQVHVLERYTSTDCAFWCKGRAPHKTCAHQGSPCI